MRPARPWSWALLVLLLVALTAAATATDGGAPSPTRDDAPHGLALASSHPRAVDAVAVLAERVPISSSHRSTPMAPMGVALLGLAVGALLWGRPAPASPAGRSTVRPPGGAGRRAPPPVAS